MKTLKTLCISGAILFSILTWTSCNTTHEGGNGADDQSATTDGSGTKNLDEGSTTGTTDYNSNDQMNHENSSTSALDSSRNTGTTNANDGSTGSTGTTKSTGSTR